jgi:protein disulfide-isomerase
MLSFKNSFEILLTFFHQSCNLIKRFGHLKLNYMKQLSTLLLFCLAITFANAQAEYTAEHEGWLVDIEEAHKQSKKTDKPVLANFTSDFSGGSKRLSIQVFAKPEFKKWAKENVVLLELEFSKSKELPVNIKQQNASLEKRFQVKGFPTIWVFNIDKDPNTSGFKTEALGQIGGRAHIPFSVEEFISSVDQVLESSEQK